MQFQSTCFDIYVVEIEEETDNGELDGPDVIKTGTIIPSVDDDGNLTLNVTTNSTLGTNMFYQATLITASNRPSGSTRFCKCAVT